MTTPIIIKGIVIAIIVLITALIAALVYLHYITENSPSIIGRGYDAKMKEKEKLNTENKE